MSTRATPPIVLGLLALLAIVLPSAVAWAQRVPQIETGVRDKDVEVGQPFTVQLSAMVGVSDRTPERPVLKAPSGMVIRSGPSIMPKTHVTLNGPNLIQQMGIVVSWTLVANRPGRYRIGPPSVMWGGKRFAGAVVEVKVHPRGRLPAHRRSDPFDLFEMFGLPKWPSSPFTSPFSSPNDESIFLETDPELAMTYEPSPLVFLRAMVDKKSALLGEQVTLSIYQYHRSSSIQRLEVHEPAASDFLQYPILDPTEEPASRYAEVGGSTWNVRLIRKVALFALRTGELTIDPMIVKYRGRGLPHRAERKTKRLQITVHEAPAKGRPLGFQSGDVGRFALNARVDPRNVEQGGAVSVTVKVQGSGNLPSSLTMPSAKGIEWLDPEVSANIEAVQGKIRGERIFKYLARLTTPGKIDLGELQLPYYDPERHRYETTRAKLGQVTVRENPQAPAKKAKYDRFAALGGPRRILTETPSKTSYLTDRWYFWLVIMASPLSVTLAGAGWTLARRTRRSVRSWRESLDRHVKVALDEASKAKKEGRGSDAAVALERAIHGAIESSTGHKSRGILRSDLANTLIDSGLSQVEAQKVVELLASCESIRFDPRADDEKLTDLVDGTRAIIRSLSRTKKAGK